MLYYRHRYTIHAIVTPLAQGAERAPEDLSTTLGLEPDSCAACAGRPGLPRAAAGERPARRRRGSACHAHERADCARAVVYTDRAFGDVYTRNIRAAYLA